MYFTVSYLKFRDNTKYYRVKGDSLWDIWSKINSHLEYINFSDLRVDQVSATYFNKLKIDELL